MAEKSDPYDLKFKSSMTLFSRIAAGETFLEALETFCDGIPDRRTLEILDMD